VARIAEEQRQALNEPHRRLLDGHRVTLRLPWLADGLRLHAPPRLSRDLHDRISVPFPSLPTTAPAESEQERAEERLQEAYRVLLIFEPEVREAVVLLMTNNCDPRWERQRVPGEVLESWKDKRRQRVERGEPSRRLVEYADFSDYLQIIIRSDNWRDVFAAIFINPVDVQASFCRLQDLRIRTMHFGMVSHGDLRLMKVEAARVLRALGSRRWEEVW
jgi:hypothetical protein